LRTQNTSKLNKLFGEMSSVL